MYALLPHVNAILNATSASLLIAGYIQIRRGNREAHRRLMCAAICTSALFLISYLVYHAGAGSTRFQGQGWVRPFYFSILISHTILAAAILPMVFVTVVRAARGSFDRHRRLARWTLPVWLYVSATGVVVYLLLYHFFPG